MFGVVSTIYQEDHSIVNVEFHDQADHPNFHFTDYIHYSMAAVEKGGVVFAAPEGQSSTDAEGDASRRASLLYYRPLENWSTINEWTVHMPEGESITSESGCI